MASGKRSKPDAVTYGDHEIITPDTAKLRKTLRTALPGEPDPIERAEAALAAISGDFSNWMHDECARLDTARRKVGEMGLSTQTRQELFLAAHDLKGDSGTLGYPEVQAAAESLCRLLEHTPDLTKIPLAIVDQHVDAVRAIVREHDRADVAQIAAALTGKLRAVTDEFLLKENQHRPDVLKVIQGPTLVPGETF
jgi:HPt (histidine-containing phosphotransfer) domain-containing protein